MQTTMSSNNNDGAFDRDREELIQRNEEFNKRRLIVMKEAITLSTTGIIELIPDYQSFDMVNPQ